MKLEGRVLTLVEAGRADAPTAADRARVRAALAARLGTAPLPNAPSADVQAAGIGAKALAGALLIGAVAFGAGFVAGTTHAPPAELARHGAEAQALRRMRAIERDVPPAAPVAVKVDAPTPFASPPTARPAPLARALVPRIAARSPVASAPELVTPPPDPPASKASSLMEETKLLGEAQTALNRGDAQDALAKLDELGARHPDGLLREERLAARILALCAAGRVDQARREAETFLVEMRGSIQASRVRASCAFAKKDDRGSR